MDPRLIMLLGFLFIMVGVPLLLSIVFGNSKVHFKKKYKVVDPKTPTIIKLVIADHFISERPSRCLRAECDVSLNGEVLKFILVPRVNDRFGVKLCYLRSGKTENLIADKDWTPTIRKCAILAEERTNFVWHKDENLAKEALQRLEGNPVASQNSLSPAVNEVSMERGLSRLTGAEDISDGERVADAT